MVFCLNPACSQPENTSDNDYCQGCGSLLAESSQEYLFRSHFKVIKQLGKGGFGRTYLFEDTEYYNQLRVLKKLIIPDSNPEVMKKTKELFAREAKQLNQLNHHQIPKLYGYFESDNNFYLVQEYIRGKDLVKELTEKGQFSEDKIKELLLSLLPVLEYINSQDIIHKDIKPENIIRRQSDQALVLINFEADGVKLVTETNNLTPIYSIGYAAPEHIRGRPTHASDIYSLGATCVRLLTGCLNTSESKAKDPIYDDYHNKWCWLEYLEKQGKKITPQLTVILQKMLANTLANRYHSATEIRQELADAISNSSQIPETVVIASTEISKPKFSGKIFGIIAGSLIIVIAAIIPKISSLLRDSQSSNTVEINLDFPEDINRYQNEELFLVITKNGNNYIYESTNLKTGEFVELKQSVCETDVTSEKLTCSWSQQGYEYLVLYNPNQPEKIRSLVKSPSGDVINELILNYTDTTPTW